MYKRQVIFKVKVHVLEPPKDIRPGFSVSGLIETDRRPSALAIPIPALVLADEATLRKPGKDKKPVPTPTPAAAAKADEKKDPLSDGKKKKEVEGVFVVKKDGTVEFRKIKTGITAELKVEVVEGLAEGDEVVTGPFKALRSLKIDDRVKVDNAAAPGAGKAS